MTSKTARNTKKDENTTKNNADASRLDMDAIAAMLEEHRAALSKSAFSALESKLDTIQAKVEDQDRRVLSLESNANAVSESITALKTNCSVLADANAKLQAKILDLEGRSRRDNIRIIGLSLLRAPAPLNSLLDSWSRYWGIKSLLQHLN